ncbi:MAG: hypothetical protein AAB638_00290 [Patescibacteria group bacterium]
MDDLFDQIAKDLPNFPHEVIRDWLLPYAKTDGWPPTSERWAYLLPMAINDLDDLKLLKWSLVKLDLAQTQYSRGTLSAFNGMYKAHVLRENNAYSAQNMGGRRLINPLKYILEKGDFPKPIVILVENGEHFILDGNHRFLAWHCAGNILNLIKQTGDSRPLEALGIQQALPWRPIQSVWLAE